MKSRHLVDPELASFLTALPGFDLGDDTLAAARRVFDAAPPAPPIDAGDAGDVSREERFVPGPSGAPEVRVLVYRPSLATAGLRAGLVHLHGGGYVLGKPERSDLRNRYLAASVGCVVVSVDYRLAPETPFPGPVEDAYAALLWLQQHAASLGVDPARLAVKGESAGGGLAASVALLARDRGVVPLCFQHLVYPMLDDRTASPTEAEPHAYAGDFVWTRRNNRYGWRSMIGGEPGGTDVSPYCAPARATDLASLPPTFLQVGALDLFVEENLEYARRLLRAGVPTELHVYPGAFHAFDLLPDTKIKSAFARDGHDALCRALGTRS